MKINSLKLVNFRNYEKLELDFQNQLNIIYGNNGVGKTNLVESIYALSLTKSFRTNNDKNLIRKGCVSAKIEGVVSEKTKNNYQVVINSEGKKVKINNDIVSKISDYINNINIVLLKPDEHTIFVDSPSVRRKLLNIEICQLETNYLLYLNNYNQILKQRNFYLKELFINGNASFDYLNILTEKLVDFGIKIYEYRNEFINSINEYINKYYIEIFDKGDLKIKYSSDYNNKTKDEILENYKKNYEKEMSIGKTLYGIHHDDIVFLLDKKNIGEWGSNGQQKNAIFSFKLAEIDVIKKKKNIVPILILDDLFSALDNKKIKNIIKLFDNDMQIFITTTDLDKIDKKLVKNANLINIKEDNIMEG